MGPEFWERWSRDPRGARRTILLTYAQVFPPLCAAVGGILVICALFDPGAPDRSTRIAIGALVFVAGAAGTALVLYLRKLVRRLHPPRDGPTR